jgi:hypothetical protein
MRRSSQTRHRPAKRGYGIRGPPVEQAGKGTRRVDAFLSSQTEKIQYCRAHIHFYRHSIENTCLLIYKEQHSHERMCFF